MIEVLQLKENYRSVLYYWQNNSKNLTLAFKVLSHCRQDISNLNVLCNATCKNMQCRIQFSSTLRCCPLEELKLIFFSSYKHLSVDCDKNAIILSLSLIHQLIIISVAEQKNLYDFSLVEERIGLLCTVGFGRACFKMSPGDAKKIH